MFSTDDAPQGEATPRVAAPRYLAAGMAELPVDDDWLTEPEAARLGSFVYTKRRDEARLGRWTAKRALAHALGTGTDHDSLRQLVIRNAGDGAPEAFVGEARAAVDISMTDRADWAACMVMPRVPDRAGIGCDLEVVEPRSARFVADWFTVAEQRLVAGAAGGDEHDELANLIWSAKESALKVLRAGLRRDTRSVEVRFVDERAGGWRRLLVVTEEGDEFAGWWRRFGRFVLTCAFPESADPPVPFVEPCPLTTAEPTHRWMSTPVVPQPGSNRWIPSL